MSRTIKLRISDCRQFAVEFEADSLGAFKRELHRALEQYNAHYNGFAPRPHLHVRSDKGRWHDAGYGRGTHIMLHTNVFEDAKFLEQIWSRCEDAYRNTQEFDRQLAGLLDCVMSELPEEETSTKPTMLRGIASGRTTMTREQILEIASELVVINDSVERWVGRRDEVYRWLDNHGITRGFDSAHNTRNAVTMSAEEYRALCDDTECLVDTTGRFGPAGVNPYKLIDEVEVEADCLYVY